MRIDPSQIDQIIVNLVLNARDAIEGAGTIHIRAGHYHLDNTLEAPVNGMPVGPYVLLTLRDNGQGMDAETLEHIFEPFFTTKADGKGTGLGLPTAYGSISQNKGYIGVSSTVGKGSVFDIYFPFHDASRKATDTGPEQGQRAADTPATLLLVEDEKAILNLNELMLRKLGYRVLAAASPDAAMRIADDWQGTIDLLVTDVIMPKMNGYELWQQLSRAQALKCLFVSGYAADVLQHMGGPVKQLNFLQKPFTMDELAAKISEVLARPLP